MSAASRVAITLGELIRAVEAAFEAVPCSCESAHYERRRIDPNCFHHDMTDEFEAVLPCCCAACKRTRSWRPDVS